MNELEKLCYGLAQSLEEVAALLRGFSTEPQATVPPASKEDPMEKIYNITPTYEAEPPLPDVGITPAQVNDELVRIANIVPGGTELIRGMMTTRQMTNLGTATPDQLKDLLHAVRQVEQSHNINKGGQQ